MCSHSINCFTLEHESVTLFFSSQRAVFLSSCSVAVFVLTVPPVPKLWLLQVGKEKDHSRGWWEIHPPPEVAQEGSLAHGRVCVNVLLVENSSSCLPAIVSDSSSVTTISWATPLTSEWPLDLSCTDNINLPHLAH